VAAETWYLAPISWQLALAGEAERLKVKLTTHPTEALRELQSWERETQRSLRLIDTGFDAIKRGGQLFAYPSSR
jgi:hypothetical protein